MLPVFSRVNVARGGAVRRVMPGTALVRVVAIPSCSRSLATSPTDWQQIGQAGTSRAASAFSSLAAASTPGAIRSTTALASGW